MVLENVRSRDENYIREKGTRLKGEGETTGALLGDLLRVFAGKQKKRNTRARSVAKAALFQFVPVFLYSYLVTGN